MDAHWRAADAVLTQAFGRPVQELELAGANGGAIQVVVESCFTLEDGEEAARVESAAQQLTPGSGSAD